LSKNDGYAWMEMDKLPKERRAELKAGFKNLNENTISKSFQFINRV